MKWSIHCLRCHYSWNIETQGMENGLPPAGSVECPRCHDATLMNKKCELLENRSPDPRPPQGKPASVRPPVIVPPALCILVFAIFVFLFLINLKGTWGSAKASDFAIPIFFLSMGLSFLVVFIYEVSKIKIGWWPFALLWAVAVPTMILVPYIRTHLGRPAGRILTDMAQVCRDKGVPQVGTYPLTPGIHPIVLLDTDGRPTDWSGGLPREWRPSNVEAVDLVACVGEERQEIVETCHFQTGPDVLRFQSVRDVTLLDAHTGWIIFSGPVGGERPRSCAPAESYDLRQLSGGPMLVGDLVEWLRPFVEGNPTQ
jgi:hypothetical protein